ncbi:uncharacterized protein B0T15DRAFT_488306 [Chaetomium strumarium]|uniref:Zn(2)-C6 fungal-type domain-containing protein n=1 Tax=Chaetomium strumarium TaxID=1170767 RepID=A0AAJ0M5J0_9PEZI|nr:hypothetical protein B0T15DRAFT_488306 [Chaetomium strumarium]
MTSEASSNNPACVECKRRKQGCDRHFPCGHCVKRKVAHLCTFRASDSRTPNDQRSNDSQSRLGPQVRHCFCVSADNSAAVSPLSTHGKRRLESQDDVAPPNGDSEHDDASDINVSDALNCLGYMPFHHAVVLGQGPGPKTGRDLVEETDVEQSEELKETLRLMPKRGLIDVLVDNFLDGANYHYYALYSEAFRNQYRGWCAKSQDKVTPELTSLILRVCTCSLHLIIGDRVREQLEELQTDVLTYANRMHVLAQKLSASIGPGKAGLVHIQQPFLTAFWFKSA